MKQFRRMHLWIFAILICALGFGQRNIVANADENSDDLVEAPTFNGEGECINQNAGIMLLTLEDDDATENNEIEDDYREWVQSDERWGSLTLGTSSYTVKQAGCLITSITKLIVQSGLKSADEFTPAELVTWMNENGGFTSGGAMYWSKITGCVSEFKNPKELLKSGTYPVEDYNDQIVKWVEEGYHMVVNVKNSSHWVAVDEARTLATGQVYMFDTVAGWVNTDITLETRYPSINRIYAYRGGQTPTPDNVIVPDEKIPYTDVNEDSWYLDAVKYTYKNGLMNGMTETTFEPESNLTRAQFATILYRNSGAPAVEYADVFSDVLDGTWYTSAVLWANEKGVVLGYPDGTFGADAKITREQMVVMMFRYAKAMGYHTDNSLTYANFADAKLVSEYAEEAMEWAIAEGVITGRPNGELDPAGTATRAECATIIMRFVEKNN